MCASSQYYCYIKIHKSYKYIHFNKCMMNCAVYCTIFLMYLSILCIYLNHYVILGTFIWLLIFFYILSYGLFSLKYDS